MSTTNMNDTENLVQVQLEDIIVCVDRETAIELQNENYAKRYLQTKTSKNQNINDHEATLTLLSLRKEVDAEFSDRRSTKKILWGKIAKTMNEMGFYIGDGETGAEKEKELAKGKLIMHPILTNLSDILGDKHKTNPIMIIDSIAPTATASTNSSAEAGSSSPAEAEGSSSSDAERSSPADAVIQLKKQRKEEFSQMMSFIERQNEMKHEQILALIKSQDKKKKGHSDSD
ncbi:hypothetical protein FQA39_LY14809 [Lamprigera yunnana]|nr:hypothetical protein FQA39_LY14809 [Lamprigera yunnana]